jgi:hypothetical protein
LAARVTEAARVLVLAAIVTVAIAAPVLRAPSERVFGMDIAGRHHDPFTVMQQFAHPLDSSVYSQPVTDVTGELLARAFGPVAAYNWLVLLSFPLSAVAAYLLGRHLALSPTAALIAAMAFAFSPFHLAQAAYHPHVAQTQWIPLYLLALWRCLDDASLAAVGLLAAATAAVTLSNFYGGLIAAVITPVAVAAYWIAARRRAPGALRRLGITVASLVFIASAGLAYAAYTAGPIVANRAAFGFPRADLFRYSAKWWSYLVPPVEHPLFGASARGFWTAAGVREGLLEQQVSLGWAIVALGGIAIFAWYREVRPVRLSARARTAKAGERSWVLPAEARPAKTNERRWVPALAVVAFAALLCSLSPERTIGGLTFVRPSALLYDVLPMFRSYARFGVVVQLMAALLAGIGIDYLLRAGARRGRFAAIALVLIAAGEYAVSPPALWRDALPTRAHRWVTRQPGQPRALDCAPLTQESASVQWLSGDRVALKSGAVDDCTEPDLPRKLAAAGFTHLIVRRGTPESQAFDDHALPDGLRPAARFPDGRVFAVTGPAPAVYTASMTGVFAREYAGRRSWRWMAAKAEWTIVNTRPHPIAATLGVELTSFHRPRRMEVMLDGRCVLTILVEPSGRVHRLGPLTIAPGRHALGFHPVDTPVPAGDEIKSHDRRRLSIAFGTWSWSTEQTP